MAPHLFSPYCVGCGLQIEGGRARIGLTTCRACGDARARLALAVKRSQVGPAFNKGGLQFLGGADARRNILDSGRKTSVVDAGVTRMAGPPEPVAAVRVRRKRIGIMWTPADGKRAWFEGEDPKALGATRWVRL